MLSNPKNSVTIGKRDHAKVENILSADFDEHKNEIGYIGMESRKTFVFKDRAVMEDFVKKLVAKKIVYSIDNIFPTPDLW
jgi:hypothetical protein